MEKVQLIGAVPIPVGHAVVIRWYEVESDGLFGTNKEERPYEPLVEDLDTGIVYGTEWLFHHAGMKPPREPVTVLDQPRAGARLTRELTGRVRRCRVLTVYWSDYDVQTELVIEPEPSRAGYR